MTGLILKQENTINLNFGCFGASTGAAAALISVNKRSENFSAIVTRVGRVNLVKKYTNLKEIICSILFIISKKCEQFIS